MASVAGSKGGLSDELRKRLILKKKAVKKVIIRVQTEKGGDK